MDDTPPPSQQVVLQTLLKDRFKLAVHDESREMPVFALMLARSDGKLGPKLTRSDFDCAAYMAGPHPPPEPGRTAPCGMRSNSSSVSARAIPLKELATTLAYFVNRFTTDKSGLTGGFDLDLTWTPDQIQ